MMDPSLDIEEELTEAALEQQLDEHLVEQRASLAELDEALACDPANEELLAVHGELCIAIKSAEESLLQLKRTRLLQEIDAVLDARVSEGKTIQEDSKTLSAETSSGRNSPFVVGSKCRFRYLDGRWYNGQILELDDDEFARVSFLTPTTEKMQMCKFFMQQRCRFGDNCRMSHGFLVSLDALKQFNPPTWQQSFVGSTVLACSSTYCQGLWRRAELETWDDTLQCGTVVVVNDGNRLEVGIENLSFSEFADVTDEESSSSEDEEGESEGVEDIENDYASFGAMVAVETGSQTETVTFANWEKHTRGMASKMMASMGYREGMGLGRTGQGIVNPLHARVLPKHLALDFIGDVLQRGEGRSRDNAKKRGRGGKRKRDKKHAEAARAAKAEKAEFSDMFGMINKQLAAQRDSEVEDMIGRGKMQAQCSVKGKVEKENRRSLIAQADEVTELRSKVERLEEMALRNRKDKAFHDAVSRKLKESRTALLRAEAHRASASLAVHSEEKEKRWLRF